MCARALLSALVAGGGDTDRLIRLAAFTHVGDLSRRYEEAVPWRELKGGVPFRDGRVQLIGQRGIVFPRSMVAPLSIMTTAERAGVARPYDDAVGTDGLLRYHYQRGGPTLRVNSGLRRAMVEGLPMIWFLGLAVGSYHPVWPVQVVDDDRGAGVVTVDVAATVAGSIGGVLGASDEPRRLYAVSEVRRRLHQARFRRDVLTAYRSSCAICNLRHGELLDASHILPDGHPRGEPVVRNGLSLCKIHHAAFDQQLIGIRPDLVVEVQRSILDEVDGPMLRHGLQDCHGRPLTVVPRRTPDRPDPGLLEERFALFRAAG